MMTIRILIFLTFLTCGAAPFSPAQQDVPSRAPFVLELPDVSDARYTLPIVRVIQQEVSTLKVRVLEPYAATITYGNIVVTLNGDGINRGCNKSSDAEGKVTLCQRREDHLGGFVMQPGKNILEIRATDLKQREFYASYVILLGDRSLAQNPGWKGGAAERFTGRKYAVVVGVSEYKYNDAGLRSLEYADDDAQSVADFLKTPEGGGFSSADTKLLLNRDASLLALRSALTEMGKKAGPNDMVFIFIAGHGAPDPLSPQNLYFLFYDTKVVDMEKTAFRMDELKRYLDSQVVADRVFVMIDTCHSAGVNQKTQALVTGRDLVREGDENNISNFYVTKQLFKEKGRAILTSSDVNEVSQESAKWGNHGVFTWALLEGMKGKADLNNDNLVTAGEIFAYTRMSVQKATNSQQNPIALPGSATNLALATVRKNPNVASKKPVVHVRSGR